MGATLRLHSIISMSDYGMQTLIQVKVQKGLALMAWFETNIPGVMAEVPESLKDVYVVPRIEPQIGTTHALGQRRSLMQRGREFLGLSAKRSRNWSGAVVQAGKWSGVAGAWRIPAVTVPGGSTQRAFNSTSWVGIDGANSQDLLQIGVRQSVDESGPAYYAWYEWFAPSLDGTSIYEMKIYDVEVAAGDDIECTVFYWMDRNRTFGNVKLKNNRSGQIFSLNLAPPKGARCEGGSVEWVMESPNNAETPLPWFGKLVFTGAVGIDVAQNGIDAMGHATCYNIEKGGQAITRTNVSSKCVTIEYLGESGVGVS
jgi:hypothetical protein